MANHRVFSFRHGETDLQFSLFPPFGAALENNCFHEPNTSMAFLELLRPGDTVVDVGASGGYYSILSNAVMRGQGRIIAFEPNPYVFAKFASHIALNRASTIMAFNLALSDRSGAARFVVDHDDCGFSRIAQDGAAPERACEEIVHCATMPLDDIVRSLGIDRIRIMKMDVEGHERHVMEGAKETLGRRLPDYVVCEINRPELLRNQCSEQSIRMAFEEVGYEAELINCSSIDICNGRSRMPYNLPDFVQANVVFNLLFRRR